MKSKPDESKVSHKYVDENGITVTVYKPQYPRLEELTFPRKKEYNELSKDIPCCAISHEPLHILKNQGKTITILKCGHIFDDFMLKSWLSMPYSMNKCPSCKKEVDKAGMHAVYL